MVTSLFAVYRILDPDEPVTWKKVLRVVISGAACTVVIPGLLRYYYQNEDPFVACTLTGLASYCFDPALKIGQKFFIKKLSKLWS